MANNNPIVASRGVDQFVLRMPDGLRSRIAAAAKANGRAMNTEMILVLLEAFPAPAQPDAGSAELREALMGMVEKYTALVNCGDCGNWNPEDEPEVQQARAAIAKAEGGA